MVSGQNSFVISAILLFHGFACSQDILFTNNEEDSRVRPTYLDTKLLTNCEKSCMNLDLCPSLFSLLENPTRSHIGVLQKASCGFTPGGNPLVWCNHCDDPIINPRVNNHVGQTQQLTSYTVKPQFPNKENSLLRNRRIQTILNQEDCGTAFPGRISGGEAAAKGEFPWIVAIGIHTSSGPQTICGGALIADDWVITAAHCVADSSRHGRNVSHVRVGAHNITKYNENGAENIPVAHVFFHEEYRERPVVKNDIALLKLRRQVVFGTTVGPICVPSGNETLESLYAPNLKTLIAGWGSDGRKPGYNILQKVEIPLVSGDMCKKLFQRVRVRVLPELQVCAGARGRDSCKGDSGGPLMVTRNEKSILIGIISYGTVQCDGRLPGVYTKMSSYMDWITTTILKHSL